MNYDMCSPVCENLPWLVFSNRFFNRESAECQSFFENLLLSRSETVVATPYYQGFDPFFRGEKQAEIIGFGKIENGLVSKELVGNFKPAVNGLG